MSRPPLAAMLALLNSRFTLDDFIWLDKRFNQGQSIKEILKDSLVPQSFLRIHQQFPDWKDRLNSELEKAERVGGKFLYPGHSDYPKAWLHIFHPPVCVFVVGECVWQRKAGLSVVGSREPLQQSSIWMQLHFQNFLAREDVFVLSGAARGIDQMAHRISILQGRETVAIIPSGYNMMYPSDFRKWTDAILDGGGAIVSEYCFDSPMKKRNFHHRNRLIAGMTNALLLVEAGERSGSLMTANLALEHHANVGVIPSHPTQAKGGGGLRLMLNGGTALLNGEDLRDWFLSSSPSQRPESQS